MKLDIQKTQKSHMFWVRVPEELFNKIEVLKRKHKTERSTIVRRLIEIGYNEVNK